MPITAFQANHPLLIYLFSGRKSIGNFKLIMSNCIHAFDDDRLCFGLLWAHVSKRNKNDKLEAPTESFISWMGVVCDRRSTSSHSHSKTANANSNLFHDIFRTQLMMSYALGQLARHLYQTLDAFVTLNPLHIVSLGATNTNEWLIGVFFLFKCIFQIERNIFCEYKQRTTVRKGNSARIYAEW